MQFVTSLTGFTKAFFPLSSSFASPRTSYCKSKHMCKLAKCDKNSQLYSQACTAHSHGIHNHAIHFYSHRFYLILSKSGKKCRKYDKKIDLRPTANNKYHSTDLTKLTTARHIFVPNSCAKYHGSPTNGSVAATWSLTEGRKGVISKAFVFSS